MSQSVQELYESTEELSRDEFERFLEKLIADAEREDDVFRILSEVARPGQVLPGPWPPTDDERSPDAPWLPPGPTWPVPGPAGPGDRLYTGDRERIGLASTRGATRGSREPPPPTVSLTVATDASEGADDELPVDVEFTVNATEDSDGIGLANVYSETARDVAQKFVGNVMGFEPDVPQGVQISTDIHNVEGDVNIYAPR